MTNFLSNAQVRILRAESQFANSDCLAQKGGLLSFPRTGCALLALSKAYHELRQNRIPLYPRVQYLAGEQTA